LSWVTDAYGPAIVGYDVCDAVKTQLKGKRYEKRSALELFLHQGHPGIGYADAFLSHAQMEQLETTLSAMRRACNRLDKLIRYFLDYFSLPALARLLLG